MRKLSLLSFLLFGLLFCTLTANALTYNEWAAGFTFPSGNDQPLDNPDGDPYNNGLEFVFGTDPLVPEAAAEVGPTVVRRGGTDYFSFQLFNDLDPSVETEMERSTALTPNTWFAVSRQDNGRVDPDDPSITHYEEIIPTGDRYFYRLSFVIPFDNDRAAKISVGSMVGMAWNGIPSIQEADIYQQNPVVIGSDPPVEDSSKYPRAIGASQHAFSPNLTKDFRGISERPRLRSWMGWFLWGNGTPPPGRKAGFDFNWDSDVQEPWDYFSYQETFVEGDENTSAWTPVRVDQQPLYMHPLRLNYNWAPGRFGFETKPLRHFPLNVFYWKDKSIVRGINLSPNYPYFIQYGDKITAEDQPTYPDAWRERWLRQKNRPLETLVLVPSVLPPADINDDGLYLLAEGEWNDVESGLATNYQPFPYPVFNSDLSPQDQTPYTVLTDRMGDWHADLVYEGGHPGLSDYDPIRYFRTPFDERADGNYLKMTVAQGSPFVWCEFGASVTSPQDEDRYMIFYNLIRQNLRGSIDNNTGTNAETVTEIDGMAGPWEVPGVDGVSYALLYGDQNNPNQFFQEVEADFKELGPPNQQPRGMTPGGFNQPGSVSNHSYFAVFYRSDSVKTVTLGDGGAASTANHGTDAQGNPYFFLEFDTEAPTYQQTGKAWFSVGQIPVMRYYHTEVTRDPREELDRAAKAWADEMGKHAFNFLTDTEITYAVDNMTRVTTEFNATFANPYAAAGAVNAEAMVAAPDTTVWALFPHHYQPLTLGPDLTKASREQVVWNPLRTANIDFPTIDGPANANRTTPSAPSRWDYWHPRGTLKSVVTGDFTVDYPFQNFLPAMPPPKWKESYEQTGIQYVTLSNVEGYTRVTEEPTAELIDKREIGDLDPNGNPITQLGSGASFRVLREPQTGQILQVDVVSPGSGYPVGNPPPKDKLELVISAPPLSDDPADRAQARVQVNGEGKVLAAFMDDKGDGYRSVVEITQADNPRIDPARVLPRFAEDPDNPGTLVMQPGPARILAGGSGYDLSQPVQTEVVGNGSGAVATVVKPGELYGVTRTGIGGFDQNGLYAIVQDDLETTGANLTVEFPPQEGVATPPAAQVNMTRLIDRDGQGNIVVANSYPPFGILVEDPGDYDVVPTGAFYMDDSEGGSVRRNLSIESLQPGEVNKVNLIERGPTITRKPVTFEGGSVAPGGNEAVAWVYPSATIESIEIAEGAGTPYPNDILLTISGGQVGPGSDDGSFEMPEFDWGTTAEGKAFVNGFKDGNNGNGFWGEARLELRGGRGLPAALRVIVSPSSADPAKGAITRVDVIRPGSNYPTAPDSVFANISGEGAGAQLRVNVDENGGGIASVDVIDGGSGYLTNGSTTVQLTGQAGASPDAFPPRGPYAFMLLDPDGSGGLQLKEGQTNFIFNNDDQAGYFYDPELGPDGNNGQTTAETPGLYLFVRDAANRQVLDNAVQAGGFISQAVPTEIDVEQVLYDNVIGQYQKDMSHDLRPFGGGFGGNSAPDGYGLGNQLSATTKWVNVLYHLQQAYAEDDAPSVTPSKWAFTAGSTPYSATPPFTYEEGLPVLAEHNPLFTLGGALETSVQMMQRTLSLLHIEEENGRPYTNEVTNQSLTWTMEYFSSYDYNVGRILINPTATIPANGVVSSVSDPPPPPASQNDPKSGLLAWEEGRLWSGFGVSDQWNDQHYFFGYYLGVAGWAAMFDRAWEPSIDGKPNDLWASRNQLGTALDQWFLSVGYDPDNPELLQEIYTVPEFTYQKLPFFDQWTGHGWATGAQPGPGGAVLDRDTPWSLAQASGTSNFKYGDENENSVWEGLQAFSAAILWGAGTDRKALADVGIYMLATGMAANDLYFADKNYNLTDSALNEFSWAPVTTTPASEVTNNGGNTYDANLSFVSANPDAYYIAPEFFGGEASTGVSLVRKYGPELENFFYAFPTGSKFITAYPPTAWTLGISRNSDYMRRFTGAYVQEDWTAARESALFQAGNWLGMAMTSALSGVPYNPGDQPLNEAGTALKPENERVQPYVDRLWSSWTSLDDVAGINAARQPAFSSTSVMHFLHALDVYGTPDWTYFGRATDSSGTDDDDSIVFTAVFSQLSDDGSEVETTFVAFNPGWENRHCAFDRMGPDGSLANAAVHAFTDIEPKKMVVETVTFPVQ